MGFIADKWGCSFIPVLLRGVGILLFAFRAHTVLLSFLLLGLSFLVLRFVIFVVQRDLDLWFL